eukprot:415276-Pelagomonas_calceolata.AAC.1
MITQAELTSLSLSCSHTQLELTSLPLLCSHAQTVLTTLPLSCSYMQPELRSVPLPKCQQRHSRLRRNTSFTSPVRASSCRTLEYEWRRTKSDCKLLFRFG